MLRRFCAITFFAVLVAILTAPAAQADGAPILVTLTGVNGSSANGVYTSPYFATVNGGQGVGIICDDYWHEVYIGESWWATANTFSTLDQARFQGPDSASTLLMYEEAAFLIEQLALDPGATNDISFAIWSIFSPGVPSTANSGWWLAYAQSQTYAPGEFANFEILTPTDSGPGSPQEYLVMVPEPASLPLLGSGLFALGVFRKRSNRPAQAS
jgi:hypothetical protein